MPFPTMPLLATVNSNWCKRIKLESILIGNYRFSLCFVKSCDCNTFLYSKARNVFGLILGRRKGHLNLGQYTIFVFFVVLLSTLTYINLV
jgi:hypothetical protein